MRQSIPRICLSRRTLRTFCQVSIPPNNSNVLLPRSPKVNARFSMALSISTVIVYQVRIGIPLLVALLPALSQLNLATLIATSHALLSLLQMLFAIHRQVLHVLY